MTPVLFLLMLFSLSLLATSTKDGAHHLIGLKSCVSHLSWFLPVTFAAGVFLSADVAKSLSALMRTLGLPEYQALGHGYYLGTDLIRSMGPVFSPWGGVAGLATALVVTLIFFLPFCWCAKTPW